MNNIILIYYRILTTNGISRNYESTSLFIRTYNKNIANYIFIL